MSKRVLPLLVIPLWFWTACGSTPASIPEPTGPPAPSAEPAPVALPEVVPEVEPEFPAWEARGVRTAYSRAGTYLLKWLPVGGPVPKNKHFEIDLWLFKAGDPLELFDGAVIATRGWMPDHRHGMLRQPRSQNLEHGHYRISGMLLHMGGYWQIFFDVVVDGLAESTQFDLHL